MKQSIYLDFAAATPVDTAALRVIEPYLSNLFYNPSAIYEAARDVRKTIESARGQVADVIGCKDQEVVFTAGGTEANNLAIHGVMRRHPNAHMIVSAIEHESILVPAADYNTSIAPVTDQGVIDVEKLASLITSQTVLISVMYANNEIGTIQPIKRITELVNSVRTQRSRDSNTTPLYVHTDACQAANYLDLQVARLGVDMMTLNGGKIYALKQSGCLYSRKSVTLTSLINGGGQERSLRSGTENVAAIVAFATMLQKVQKTKKAETKRLTALRDELFATISQKLSHVTVNGSKLNRLPNNLNLHIPSVDGERMVMELDEAGVMAATGSACSASSDEPSHVLTALGMTDDEATASLRITLGRTTTKSDIEMAGDAICKVASNPRLLI